MTIERLYTAKEVAALLGLHPKSIWRYVNEGKLAEPIKRGSRFTRWKQSDVERFINPPPPPAAPKPWEAA